MYPLLLTCSANTCFNLSIQSYFCMTLPPNPILSFSISLLTYLCDFLFFLALLRVLRDLRTELTNSSFWTSKSLPQSIDITNMRWMSDTLPHQYTARLKSKLYRVNRSLIYIIATSLLFWAEGSILHHRHHQQQQQQQLHKILLQYFVALVWKIYFIFCWGIFCFWFSNFDAKLHRRSTSCRTISQSPYFSLHYKSWWKPNIKSLFFL